MRLWNSGTFPKYERTVLRAVDLRPGQIRGQQVGRELQAVEIAFHAVAQHLDGAGLRQPGRTLHQQVPVATAARPACG